MKTRHSKDKQAQELLARGALYRWLARGFAYPEAGHAREMARAFARLDRELLGEILPPRLMKALARAGRAWRGRTDAELAADYVRLFLGSGPVLLHETAYGDARRIAGRSAELADVSGFYLAFGVKLAERDPDLPDHASVELEFLSLLFLKEAYALARGRLEPYRVARDAAAAFLRDHLGRWLEPLCRSLGEHAPASPYAALAQLAEQLVAHECRRRRVSPVPAEGPLPPDIMQAETFACPHESTASASSLR
jgi:DMSO reductase family type II enzyme chaperone